MKIEYDREADALYKQLRKVLPVDNLDIEEGVTVDLDGGGHIIGIEVLDAVERLGLEALLNVSIENMPLEEVQA